MMKEGKKDIVSILSKGDDQNYVKGTHHRCRNVCLHLIVLKSKARFLRREFYLLCCLNLTDQIFYKRYHENAHKNLNNHKQKNKRMFLCSNNSIIKIMSCGPFVL